MRVFNSTTSLKLTPLANLHPGLMHVEDEGRMHQVLGSLPLRHGHPDRLTVAMSPFGRDARDQSGEAGNGPVRTPEFLAMHDKLAAG